MKVYDASHIKNIAVVGHGGDGKTTLVEALLFDAGAIERRGKVEDGTTTTDNDPEEIRRHISITTSIAPVEWSDCKLNLIDAPGFFDFVGETTQAYNLADSALILANGFSGVGVGAEKAYKYCKKAGKPMAVVINQMDKEHADFTKTAGQLKDKFGAAITVVQLPIMDGMTFKGYVDIVENAAYEFDPKGAAKKVDIPAALESEVETLREALVENAAANDEELMEKFFEGEELSKEDILKGLLEGIAQCDVVPVFAASALQNLGVRELADALATYLPPAAKNKPVHAVNDKGEDVEVSCTKDGAFAAQVLKTIADPFVGKISILKVFRGELKADTALLNVNANKSEKFGNITIMRGKKPINVPSLQAGDIGALAKLQYTTTGDSLCAGEKLTFDPVSFGEPCISLAVTAKKQGEEEKVFAGLHRLEEEDPTFRDRRHTALRHGRDAHRGHLPEAEEQVRRGGGALRAACGLPRDHPQIGRGRGQTQEAVGRRRAVWRGADPLRAYHRRFRRFRIRQRHRRRRGA